MQLKIFRVRLGVGSASIYFLYDLLTVVAFAVVVRQQAIALRPQGFVFQCLCMDSVQAFVVKLFDNLGRNAGYERVRRYDGALGYNCAGSDDGAVTDNCAVKHGGMHADEAVVFDGAGMQQCAVADGNKITDDAGIFISNMQHAVVLNVAVAANLDAVDVAADGYARPDAGIFLELNLADKGGSVECVSFFINFGSLSFKFKNHIITTF